MAGEDLLNQCRTGARHADDENGVVGGMPLPHACPQKFGRARSDDLINLCPDRVRIILQFGASQGVCAFIMGERRVMIAAFFHRLAQRKMQMILVFCTKAGRCQSRLHRGNIFIREAGCFQIGKAPPNFAQGRLDRKRAAIGCNALVLMANGFEHMAIAHPQFGVVGKPCGQFLIKRNCLFIAADTAKCRGLQILLDGVVTPLGQHGVEMLKRFGKAILFIQYRRQIGPRGTKIGRQLERPTQQSFAILQPANARGQLGHHANGRHIGGCLAQMASQ